MTDLLASGATPLYNRMGWMCYRLVSAVWWNTLCTFCLQALWQSVYTPHHICFSCVWFSSLFVQSPCRFLRGSRSCFLGHKTHYMFSAVIWSESSHFTYNLVFSDRFINDLLGIVIEYIHSALVQIPCRPDCLHTWLKAVHQFSVHTERCLCHSTTPFLAAFRDSCTVLGVRQLSHKSQERRLCDVGWGLLLLL
jgi:hypothetical protein